MAVQIEMSEIQAVAGAVDYFLYMKDKAQRHSLDMKRKCARLILVSERLHEALDAQEERQAQGPA